MTKRTEEYSYCESCGNQYESKESPYVNKCLDCQNLMNKALAKAAKEAKSMTNPQPTAEEIAGEFSNGSYEIRIIAEKVAKKYHQSRLQAISEEVEKRQEELGQAAYLHDKNGNIHEAYKARCKNEAYSEILEIITNHTSDD